MKVGDLAIVGNLGEMKVYKAEARDLEAEAGLKPQNIKLTLVDARDYVASHWKIQDIVTDEAGRFKGGGQGRGEFTQGSIGERHELENRVEADIINAISKDIDTIIKSANPPKWFLALPETIYDKVIERISPAVREKLFVGVKKDLTKADKKDLPELLKKKLA